MTRASVKESRQSAVVARKSFDGPNDVGPGSSSGSWYRGPWEKAVGPHCPSSFVADVLVA